MKAPVKLWRYVLPSIAHEGWAIIVLGSDGYFSAVSDFGNYAYLWSDPGVDDFRKFIGRIHDDVGYTGGKLGGRFSQVYDGEATVKSIKHRIIELRRRGDLSTAEAREEWEKVDGNIEHSEAWFGIWWEQTKLQDAHEYSCRSMRGDLRAFCEKIMPRLWAVVRAELEAEGLLATKESA